MNGSPPSTHAEVTPRGVICAGIYASGSTWAFNITAILIRLKGYRHIARVYVDTLDDRSLESARSADALVVKTHSPDAAFRALLHTWALPVVLTVRDPRDAVVSMMERFGRDFRLALDEVCRSTASILQLYRQSTAVVLRYEDRPTGEAGVAAIATFLDIRVSDAQRRTMARLLSTSSVNRRINALLERGVFTGSNPAAEWEPHTQWHPRHIGDGRVDKYRAALSRFEIGEVASRTRAFCEAFGYRDGDSER